MSQTGTKKANKKRLVQKKRTIKTVPLNVSFTLSTIQKKKEAI